MNLSANQITSMLQLNNHVGKTVDVLTSEYTANVDPSFVRRAVGVHSSSALRGLEKKGFIKIEQAYWKGATITVLKAYDEMDEPAHCRSCGKHVTKADLFDGLCSYCEEHFSEA